MYNSEEMGFSTKQIHAARPEPVGPAPLQSPICRAADLKRELDKSEVEA